MKLNARSELRRAPVFRATKPDCQHCIKRKLDPSFLFLFYIPHLEIFYVIRWNFMGLLLLLLFVSGKLLCHKECQHVIKCWLYFCYSVTEFCSVNFVIVLVNHHLNIGWALVTSELIELIDKNVRLLHFNPSMIEFSNLQHRAYF